MTFADQEPGAAAQDQGIDPEAQRRAEMIAEHQNHPHTRLKGILKDLQAPTALDINGRVASVHRAVAGLAQIILQHTPEGPPHPDDPRVAADPSTKENEFVS